MSDTGRDLAGRTAVVTGATRGLGAAVATALARDGATVVCAGRDADALADRVASLEGEAGQVESLRTDVRDEYDLERVMETAARRGGSGIDVVVAAAAVSHRRAEGGPGLADGTYSAFDDVVRTNLRGVYATVREAMAHLTDDARVLVPTHRGGGGMDDMEGQGDARGPLPGADRGTGAYAVSKAATTALVRQFAAELPQVVGGVDPGPVRTDLLAGGEHEPEEVVELFRWAAAACPDETLDGRVLTAEDRESG